MSRKPEIGDYVKIGKFINSEIIDINGNVVTLYDGHSLKWNGINWELVLKSEEISFYQYDVGSLPLYPMLNILINADEEKFKLLCMTNSELNDICKGNLTKEFISKYGNLTEELYEGRVRNYVPAEIITYAKPQYSTWREFYTAYKDADNTLHLYTDDDVNDEETLQKIFNYGNFLHFLIFANETNFDDYESYKNLFISSNDPIILKYVLDKNPNIQFDREYADYAASIMQYESAKFLASLDPPVLPNQTLINDLARYPPENKRAQKMLNFYASLNPPLLPTN